MRTMTILILSLALGSCSGASPLAPVMDPAGLMQAAGIAAQCVGAEAAVVAPAFDVDWSGGGVSYGGGVFLGCESSLFRFRCHQVAQPDGSKAWTCEPLSSWVEVAP